MCELELLNLDISGECENPSLNKHSSFKTLLELMDTSVQKLIKNEQNSIKKKCDEIKVDLTNNNKDENTFVSQVMAECCTTAVWKKRLPVLEWLPKYSWSYLIKDFLAGLTVGLTAIPQGLAYAVVAGLQPQYGLYSGFMGCFVYFLLGGCKDITIGPTAITALMVQRYVESHGPDLAVLLTFLTGCIVTLFGILHLGFLVEFISMPVTVGFTSAAALTIGSGQLTSLFGLPGKPNTFIESWSNFFTSITQYNPWDTALGLSTIALLIIAKKLKEKSENMRSDAWWRASTKNTVWLVGLGRNAFVVILGTFLAFIFYLYGMEPFRLTGHVESGLPPFQPPPFSTRSGNETLSFLDMTHEMGSAIIAIPLIAILESIAIAKAFSKGKSLDASQEMIALGVCNIAGSFVSSFPTTGSFTRTAVNNASGVVTPAGGLVTGALVILALSFLTSTFFFIPKATLAGVIICAMIYMIEYHAFTMLWRTKKVDIVPFVGTMLTCLFAGLEYGILVGVALNLIIILYHSARPDITMQWIWVDETEVLLVTPSQNLVFPATEYIRDVIIQHCSSRASLAPVILDGTHIHSIDSTMAKGVKLLVEDLSVRGQQVFFWRWQESAMFTVLGYDSTLSRYFRFDSSMQNIFKVADSNGTTVKNDYGAYVQLATSEEDLKSTQTAISPVSV